MPNRRHLVLCPDVDGEMRRLLRWVAATRSVRYPAHDHTLEVRHFYEGRSKSFPIQDDP